MRRFRLLPLLLLLAATAAGAFADTGTYRIMDYRVSMVPHSDGRVDITYYQKWAVTGGHIPWITVGLANSDFAITKSGLAVRSIAAANQGDWSGVRIDLDRDYQPTQTFEVSFSVTQNRLFYADQTSYRLDFIPGWYDRAVTDRLEVRVKYFAKPEVIKASPTPTSRTADELIWTMKRMEEGERFHISVSFPKTVYGGAIPAGNLQRHGRDAMTSESSGAQGVAFAIIFIIIVIWIVYNGVSGRYTGGGIFYGGGSGGGGRRSTGGGGGFGGGGFSCACACVSCACACACAGGGGGGAGCSRKQRHQCPACAERRREHDGNR